MGTVQKPRFDDYQIGPSSRMKRLRGLFGFALLFILIGGLFAHLFYQLTLSWKIALGSVTIMISFMLLSGWWAERSASGSDNSIR